MTEYRLISRWGARNRFRRGLRGGSKTPIRSVCPEIQKRTIRGSRNASYVIQESRNHTGISPSSGLAGLELGIPADLRLPEEPKERRHTVEGPDRTINWKRWLEMPGGDFRTHHQVASAGEWYGKGFHTQSKFSDVQRRSVDAGTHSVVNRKDRAGSPGSNRTTSLCLFVHAT